MKIEIRGSALEGPSRFADALAEALPEVIGRIDDCLSQLLIFVRGHLPKLENNHAAATVFNQAANDFSDLCFELVTCRGRPALRASRALFEHLINYRDVTDDPESQQRYEQHHAVAAQVEADAEIGLNRLTGDAAKSVRHMLRKLRRDSKKDYDKAIASYGNSLLSGTKWRLGQHVPGGLVAEYPLGSLPAAKHRPLRSVASYYWLTAFPEVAVGGSAAPPPGSRPPRETTERLQESREWEWSAHF